MLVNSVPQIVQHARMRMNTLSRCQVSPGSGRRRRSLLVKSAANYRHQCRMLLRVPCAALCACRSKSLSAPAHAAHLRDNLDVPAAPIASVEPMEVTTSVHQHLVGLLLFDLKLSAALRYAWAWFVPATGAGGAVQRQPFV